MPPAIHPVELLRVLRHQRLTPAIVFLTSRRACDEAIGSFEHRQLPIPPTRSAAITQVLDQMIVEYPSIADHPLIPTVQRYGVAAHHAGHLPSWKIAIEELMRQGCLDAVFATTTLAAGVDFPARTVVITQSSVRKDRDIMELTVNEIQQLAGRGGRRGKDYVGFVVVTPSPYIDLGPIANGLTNHPEPIDSQFVVSYPMVLNLLKAHSIDHIQPILEKSFAQFQLNHRADTYETKLDDVEAHLEAYGQRECADWIAQWQSFNLAKKRRSHHRRKTQHDPPEVSAQLAFLTPGRAIELSKDHAIVLRQYRSRGQGAPMLTVMRNGGRIVEYPASAVTAVIDEVIDVTEARRFPWCTPQSLNHAVETLEQFPARLRRLPIRVDQDGADKPDSDRNAQRRVSMSDLSGPSRVSKGPSAGPEAAAGRASPDEDHSCSAHRTLASLSATHRSVAEVRLPDPDVPTDVRGRLGPPHSHQSFAAHHGVDTDGGI